MPKNFLNLLLLLMFSACAFASHLPGRDTLEHDQRMPANGSLNTIQKETEIIRIIDSLMDMQSVPVSMLNEVLDKIRETNNQHPESPGAEYYSSWDEQNLFPAMEERKFVQEKILLTGSKQGDFFYPVPGKINSPFGWRDNRMHKGTDMDLVKGEPVHAAFDGVVRIAKKHGGFGNVVIIRHYNGLETVYGHLSKFKVKPGQTVLSGQVIGLGGNTGKSTGAHLHFEIRFKGNAVDPRNVINFYEQKLICDEIIIKNKGEYCSAYPSKMVMYTISEGDTLSRIAKRYGITVSKLKALNGLTQTGAVKPGQRIRIS